MKLPQYEKSFVREKDGNYLKLKVWEGWPGQVFQWRYATVQKELIHSTPSGLILLLQT